MEDIMTGGYNRKEHVWRGSIEQDSRCIVLIIGPINNSHRVDIPCYNSSWNSPHSISVERGGFS